MIHILQTSKLADSTLKSREPMVTKLLGIDIMPYGEKADRWYRYYSMSNIKFFSVSLIADLTTLSLL